MANLYNFPSYLIPLAPLTGPLRVISEPKMSTDEAGQPKVSDAFPNMLASKFKVQMIRGTQTVYQPDGNEITSPEVAEISVTIWNAKPVTSDNIRPGSWITLVQPAVGQVDRSLFVQALGFKMFEIPKPEAKHANQ